MRQSSQEETRTVREQSEGGARDLRGGLWCSAGSGATQDRVAILVSALPLGPEGRVLGTEMAIGLRTCLERASEAWGTGREEGHRGAFLPAAFISP